MSGHEVPAIPGGGENPSSWEHPEIVDAFQPLDPTNANNQAQQFYQISELWDTGLRTFARSIQASIDQAWSGAAAQASKDSIHNYVQKAEELTAGLSELSTRVTEAASAITQTKSALPDPVVITWTSWLWPPNRWDLQNEQTEEEQAARAAMNNYYVQPFKAIDSSIPVLPTPVSPTSSPDITLPPGGKWIIDDDGTGGDGSGGDSGGPNSDGPGESGPGSEEPGEGEQPEEGQSEETENSEDPSDSSTTPSSQDPAGTTPAGTNPAGTNPSDPSRTVPSGSNPSGPGSGSPGSPGSGSPSSPGSSTPQPGRSIPGAGLSTTATPAGASSTAAAAGGAGRAGMGGMGAPGGRGGGQDEESARKTPDYLITQENTDELLGDVPPALPGGVIGGEPA